MSAHGDAIDAAARHAVSAGGVLTGMAVRETLNAEALRAARRSLAAALVEIDVALEIVEKLRKT